MKKVAVIILNFNGTDDTLDCLRSIKQYENKPGITVFLLDNASRPEEVALLDDALGRDAQLFFCGNTEEAQQRADWPDGITLIHSNENMGFARGNNFCMRIAVRAGFDYCLLMNNDTELVGSEISKLVLMMDSHEEYAAMSTVISYWSAPEKVWNAGGRIYFGTRKYYLNEAVERWKAEGADIVPVQFLTGCFLMMRCELLEAHGYLSERFFFGEEDYEFSMRYAHLGMKMGVIVDSNLLHKVGRSLPGSGNQNISSKGFVHRLNRIINMRSFYPWLKWLIWREISMMMLAMKMRDVKMKEIRNYFHNLRVFSEVFDGISHDLFQWILQHDMTQFYSKKDAEQIIR